MRGLEQKPDLCTVEPPTMAQAADLLQAAEASIAASGYAWFSEELFWDNMKFREDGTFIHKANPWLVKWLIEELIKTRGLVVSAVYDGVATEKMKEAYNRWIQPEEKEWETHYP